MTTQGLFQQVGGQIPATAPLSEGMAFEVVHHPAGQRDVDAFGTGGIGHRSRAGSRGLPLDPLLQLLNQILKQRHVFVNIYSLFIHNNVQDKVA